MKFFLPLLYLTLFSFCSLAQTFSEYQVAEEIRAQSEIRQWQLFGDKNEALQYHITDERITVHTPTGSHNIARPSSTMLPAFSQNGRFLTIITMDSLPSRERHTTAYTANIYDSQLRLQHTVILPAYFDEGPPILSLSDRSGSLITGRAATGSLRFYDSTGKQLAELNLFPDADFDLERVMIIRQSGDKVVVLATRRASAPADGADIYPDSEPHVFVFTSAGQEITRLRLPGYAANQLQLSGNGQYLAVNSYTAYVKSGRVDRYASLYTIAGEKIWVGDILFKSAHFSENNRYLLIADNTLWLMIDVLSGTQVCRGEISDALEMITAVAAADDGSGALLIARNEFRDGAFIFTEPWLGVINNRGETVQSIQFVGQTYQQPALFMSPTGSRLQLAFHQSIQLYRKAP